MHTDAAKHITSPNFTRRWLWRPFTVCAAVFLLALVITPTTTASPKDLSATQCHTVNVPVQVGPQSGPISGTLCTPPNATAVQLLIHGWAYGQYYFDSPYQPEKYSYVQAANKAGYATLTIDRLGSGASLHPASVFDTFNADVKSVHSVIQALRNGTLGTSFSKVVEVGHSLGALVTAAEAGQYQDVDGIITTGHTHVPNYINVLTQIVGPSVDYPAVTDEKFANSGLDPAYITSVPGTRDGFYNLAEADPNIIKMDERLKQTQTLVELADVPTEHLLNTDRNLNIPVLAVAGEYDQVFCGLQTASCGSSEKIANYERQWYGPKATVEGHVVPNGGHDIQLQNSSPMTTNRMLDFVNKHIGKGNGLTGTSPGRRPPAPPPPRSDLNPVAQTVNTTFINAVVPTFREIANASKTVPGLGTQNEDPSHIGAQLHKIGDINDQILGTLPREILGAV